MQLEIYVPKSPQHSETFIPLSPLCVITMPTNWNLTVTLTIGSKPSNKVT